MSVSEQTPYQRFTGNGVADEFSLPYGADLPQYIKVTVDGVPGTYGGTYTVTGLTEAAGTLVFADPPAADAEIVTWRETPANRITDYTNNVVLDAEALDADIDRVVHLIQENDARYDRLLDGMPDIQVIIDNIEDISAAADLVVTRVVATIEDLRDLLSAEDQYATVLGYYAPGDGGGGLYYYDANDPTAVDNGGTIIVANDGARWKLRETRTISVEQFGASAERTGTQNADAIQAAIVAHPGSDIYFNSVMDVNGPIMLSRRAIEGVQDALRFTGRLLGSNSAEITFTNQGQAADTDDVMETGFCAYPQLIGVGGDNSGLLYVTIDGLSIVGPLHGASILLSNSISTNVQNCRFISNRYGIVTECCIDTDIHNNAISDFTNAGIGLLATKNQNIWYGADPEDEGFDTAYRITYWNENPRIIGNAMVSSYAESDPSTPGSPAAFILDYGSNSAGTRTIKDNIFYSRYTEVEGEPQYDSCNYGYVCRKAQPTLERNLFENVSYPIRILTTDQIEPETTLYGVTAAEPAGSFPIDRGTNAKQGFFNGYSFNFEARGNDFLRGLIDIEISGVANSLVVGPNKSTSTREGRAHIKSISEGGAQRVLYLGSNVATEFLTSFVGEQVFVDVTQEQIAFTPTVTSETGTIDAYTVHAASYVRHGPKIEVRYDFTISDAGTGSGALIITMPPDFTNIGHRGVFVGSDGSARTLTGTTPTNEKKVYVKRVDGSSPIGTERYYLHGTYLIA